MFGARATEPMARPLRHLIGRGFVLTFTSIGLLLGAIACGSEVAPSDVGDAASPIPATATPEPYVTLPDGWTRTQVSAGFLVRFTTNPLASFTIALPPGWSAGESRPSGDLLTGWIAAPLIEPTGKVPVMSFLIGSGPARQLERIKEDRRYEVTELEIGGVSVVLRLAAPDAIDEGPQIGAFYEHIPGAPDEIVAPSLDIEGDSRGFDDQELLGQILRSVRYSELSSLPDRPVADEIDTSDWVRSEARTDAQSTFFGAGNFSLLLPPGWTTTEDWSIDSASGTISGDGIKLSYDFLGGVMDPDGPGSIAKGLPRHIVWEEQVDGVFFSFIRPESSEPDSRAVTGAAILLPGHRDDGTLGGFWLPISGSGLNSEQQEHALAVLRSIRGVQYVER
jgi:hypothetical protein